MAIILLEFSIRLPVLPVAKGLMAYFEASDSLEGVLLHEDDSVERTANSTVAMVCEDSARILAESATER